MSIYENIIKVYAEPLQLQINILREKVSILEKEIEKLKLTKRGE